MSVFKAFQPIMFTFFSFPLSDWIAAYWIGDLRALFSIRIIAVFLPSTCLCAVMSGYYTACGKIKQLVLIEIAERLLSLAVTVMLLKCWANRDTGRACCAIVGGSGAGCIFDFILLFCGFLKNEKRIPLPKENLHIPSRLFKLCIPLALGDYLRNGLAAAEQFLIPLGLSRGGASYTQSMSAYGTIHGMVFPILMFPSVILYSLSDLLVPEFSRCRAGQNHRRILSLTGRCLRLGIIFSSLIAGFFYVCAPCLGELIYHSSLAGNYMALFAPLLVMLYLDVMVDGMLKGLGQQVSNVRYNTATSLLDVLLLLILLPSYGIDGYYFSFFVTHLLNFILSIRRLCLVTDYQISIAAWGKVILSILTAAAVPLLLFSEYSAGYPVLFARGACFLLLSTAFLVLTGAVTMRDIRWLLGQRTESAGIDIYA